MYVKDSILHRLLATFFILILQLHSSALVCFSGNIASALTAVQSGGEPFAFYGLDLSTDEKITLAQISLDEFSNNLLKTFFPNLEDDDEDKFACDISWESKVSKQLTYELEGIFAGKIESSLLHAFSAIIFTKVCDILSWGEFPGAEVVLRISPAYSYEASFHCSMWHVDKSYQELRESIENTNTSSDKGALEAHHEKFDDLAMIFLLPLLGEGALFHNLSLEHRARFDKLARESNYFYNIPFDNNSGSSSCPLDILNRDFVCTEEDSASVHKIGKGGCLHSSPFVSNQGRINLIVTPLIKRKMSM